MNFFMSYLTLTAPDGRKSLVNPMYISEIVGIENNLKETNPNCNITVSFPYGCKVYQETFDEVREMVEELIIKG